jgi:hypothetical protein
MRRLSLLLLGATLAVTACSDDDLTQPSPTSSAPSVSSTPSATSVYAVLTDDTWRLQEADYPIASIERLEWYAEYVQSSTSKSSMVRLSGHGATFDEIRADLAEVGFVLDDVALQHWQAAGGSAPDDPGGPTIIVLDNGPTTLMTLSYELDLDQLTPITDTIEGVDQTTWIAAGGVIQ